MKEETLRSVFLYGEELIRKAEEIQENTFKRLSPDCESRIMNFNGGSPCCRKTASGSQALECVRENCPLIYPKMENVADKDGLGIA